MPTPMCHERDELERRINAVLRQLATNANAASNLARKAQPENAHEFDALHKEDILLKERLQTLKDCLLLHKDWHGC